MLEEFRKSAPESLAPRAFNIAQPSETILANGLRLIVFEDKRFPLVSLRLIFLAGDAYDSADAVGLTSSMASMLTEGTENYSSRSLAEEVERLGASLGASSGSDNSRVSASCLTPYLSDMMRLLSEVVLKPTFPQNELDLYKANTIEGLKFQRSQASFLAAEQVSRIIYGEHPYSIASPSAADIERIDREMLAAQHQRTFIPNNAVMVAVGDIETAHMTALVEEYFGEWLGGEKPDRVFPPIPARDRRTLTIVNREGSSQANIVIALPGPRRGDPDFFPVMVMNQVLGAGASSRVFMNLREEKGYTYGAYTKFDMKRLGGEFEATAEVRTSVTGDSLREFFFELARIRDEQVSGDELRDAKNFLTGVFPIRAETQEGLTNLIVQQKVYGLADDYLQTYREMIASVTAEDVLRTARKYIKPETAAIVIVGDAGEILAQARSFAEEIEIFDTEGARLDVADFERAGEPPAVDVTGQWALEIDFQGQKLPVTLSLSQEGPAISGTLSSMLGEGVIENGKIAGSSFNAVAVSEVQGQSLGISISGIVVDGTMKGSITAPIVPEPLLFSGTLSGK